MRKRMKKVSALILAASLLCSAFVLPEVYAAVGVKTDEKCSLQVNCNVQMQIDKETAAATPYNPVYGELNTEAVTVNLYKVADITMTGKYAVVSPFESLTDLEDAKKINSETSAATWQTLAAQAKAVVKENTISPVDSKDTSKSGTVTFTDLETGMYLIDAQQLLTAEYRYEFTPYLISLPNNYFYSAEKNDAWDYDLIDNDASDEGYEGTTNHAVGLKPQQFDRYGYLVIEKELLNYNETNPSAVFVYEVTAKKAVKDKSDVVFNDVVAIDFTNPGNDSVKVGPIKAGAEVTVTEVYQGAGYEQTKVVPEKSQIIVANTYWDECDTYKDAKVKSLDSLPVNDIAVTAQNKTFVKFVFENQHNDVPNGGTGVVNTFTAGASWGLVQDYQGQSAPQQSVPQQ